MVGRKVVIVLGGLSSLANGMGVTRSSCDEQLRSTGHQRTSRSNLKARKMAGTVRSPEDREAGCLAGCIASAFLWCFLQIDPATDQGLRGNVAVCEPGMLWQVFLLQEA